MKRLTAVLFHATMLALVCAIGAYWVVRVMTPQPTAAPPPMAAPVPREPDAVLAARMFGLVQAPQVRVAANVQVTGVFAAGRDSSAVLVVDGKPPRVFLVGQEVAPGTRLVDVGAESVVLEGGAGRQELQLPSRPVAALDGPPPQRAYQLDGNTLSAPPAAGGSIAVPAPPPIPAPGAQFRPPPGAPATEFAGQPGQPVPPPPVNPTQQ